VPSQREEKAGGFLSRRSFVLICFVVLVGGAVFVVYRPVLYCEAQSFDDHQYLMENVLVQNPGWSSASRFLTEVLEPSTVAGYYQPLAMISLMFDYALGGRTDNLFQFHLTSLLLHIANTMLIIVLLYLLFGRAWIAALVGLIFGLHPMTVEPIPWVGERKTLLAAFFAIWCLIFYVRFTKRKSWVLYTFSCLFYFLALMSKPTSTPLPALMLLMDYWPLRRLNKKSFIEKLPLFAIGAVSAAVTYISQERTAVAILQTGRGLEGILFFLCHNIFFYLYKIFLPINLTSHYPYPEPLNLSNPVIIVGVVFSFVLIVVLIVSLKWTAAAMTCWLFFFIGLLPTMGIVKFTNVIASDKFAYLPSVGLLMALTSLIVWFCSSGKRLNRSIFVGLVVLALAFAEGFATRAYIAKWRSTRVFFEYMLKLAPDSAALYNEMAGAYQSLGRHDEASSLYQRALRLDPARVTACNNLGTIFLLQGKPEEAIKCFRRVVEINPEYFAAYGNMGQAYEELGEIDKAVDCYNQILKIKPDNAQAYYNLGSLYHSGGRLDEAVKYYKRAIEAHPNFPEAHNNLGIILFSRGQIDDAIEHYRRALKAKASYVDAHSNFGTALLVKGKFDEAMRHFKKALSMEPDLPASLCGLAEVLTAHPEPAVRDIAAAVRLAEKAGTVTDFQNSAVLDILSRCYAADGRLDEAIKTAERALRLAEGEGDDELAATVSVQLRLYKSHKSEP